MTTFAFPGAPPPRELWELQRARRLAPGRRPPAVGALLRRHRRAERRRRNGSSIDYGGDARLATGPLAFAAAAKFNDWGPYDYHRDFNLTYPVQLMGDLSHSLGMPRWFGIPADASRCARHVALARPLFASLLPRAASRCDRHPGLRAQRSRAERERVGDPDVPARDHVRPESLKARLRSPGRPEQRGYSAR